MKKVFKKDVKIDKLLILLKNKDFEYGHVIAKCNLVDCVYMTQEYIENLKNTNYTEYICGEYTVGRYAWVLENIEVLNEPIYAKGKLGVWNL
ncbi:hypothetical protein D3C81_1935740 [compost metagenome]